MGSSITVTITGLQAVLNRLKIAEQELREKANDAIQGAGIDCQALAKQACPVDTGRLRSSIQYVPDRANMSCTVGTNVEYAPFVEMGHRTRGGKSFVAPRPFLYPAFAQASKQMVQEMGDILK